MVLVSLCGLMCSFCPWQGRDAAVGTGRHSETAYFLSLPAKLGLLRGPHLAYSPRDCLHFPCMPGWARHLRSLGQHCTLHPAQALLKLMTCLQSLFVIPCTPERCISSKPLPARLSESLETHRLCPCTPSSMRQPLLPSPAGQGGAFSSKVPGSPTQLPQLSTIRGNGLGLMGSRKHPHRALTYSSSAIVLSHSHQTSGSTLTARQLALRMLHKVSSWVNSPSMPSAHHVHAA